MKRQTNATALALSALDELYGWIRDMPYSKSKKRSAALGMIQREISRVMDELRGGKAGIRKWTVENERLAAENAALKKELQRDNRQVEGLAMKPQSKNSPRRMNMTQLGNLMVARGLATTCYKSAVMSHCCDCKVYAKVNAMRISKEDPKLQFICRMHMVSRLEKD